jgi:DNA-binding MarR family transcriptional regulator
LPWIAVFRPKNLPVPLPVTRHAECSLTRTMHATLFRLKRAHLSSLRIARQILRKHPPLTPARLDLLVIVHLSPHRFVDQGALTHQLGLHPSTVSKMLKRLDELGLTERHPVEHDCRKREVYLTTRGREIVEEAMETILSSGIIDLAVDCALGPRHVSNARYCRRQILRANRTLRRYARALSDTAIALYTDGCVPYASAEEAAVAG